MASLDVSQAFDSSFLSELQHLKYDVILNADGVFIQDFEHAVTKKFLGVVTPINSRPSNVQENQFNINSIQIYTQYPLRHQTGDNVADFVLYKGLTYKVNQVQDYSEYGAGFCKVICELMQLDGSLKDEL